MSLKAILVLCAQVLLFQSALGQCTSRAAVADISGFAAPYGSAAPCGLAVPALSYGGLGYPGAGCACRGLAYDGICGPSIEFSPTSGGALPVSSASAIAPVGISIVTDLAYEGALAVGGELPFVGTIDLEGALPTAGAGAINHACGNGINTMISETAAFSPAAGVGPLAAYGPGATFGPAALAAPDFGLCGGLAGRCGCAI